MAIQHLNEGDSGSIFRTIINAVIDAVNGFTNKIADLTTKVTNLENSQSSSIFTEQDRTKLNAAVTSQQLENGLGTKVTAVPGRRMITEAEGVTLGDAATKSDLQSYVKVVDGQSMITTEQAAKIANSINSSQLTDAVDTRVKLDTKDIELVEDVYENVILYARDEGENAKQVKISLPTLLSEIKTTTVYPTYKTLEGIQNGSNAQFKYRGTLIQETAELYIGGLLYPVNIGFTIEADTIVITGAPVPKAEDIMRLKAIYLT